MRNNNNSFFLLRVIVIFIFFFIYYSKSLEDRQFSQPPHEDQNEDLEIGDSTISSISNRPIQPSRHVHNGREEKLRDQELDRSKSIRTRSPTTEKVMKTFLILLDEYSYFRQYFILLRLPIKKFIRIHDQFDYLDSSKLADIILDELIINNKLSEFFEKWKKMKFLNKEIEKREDSNLPQQYIEYEKKIGGVHFLHKSREKVIEGSEKSHSGSKISRPLKRSDLSISPSTSFASTKSKVRTVFPDSLEDYGQLEDPDDKLIQRILSQRLKELESKLLPFPLSEFNKDLFQAAYLYASNYKNINVGFYKKKLRICYFLKKEPENHHSFSFLYTILLPLTTTLNSFYSAFLQQNQLARKGLSVISFTSLVKMIIAIEEPKEMIKVPQLISLLGQSIEMELKRDSSYKKSTKKQSADITIDTAFRDCLNLKINTIIDEIHRYLISVFESSTEILKWIKNSKPYIALKAKDWWQENRSFLDHASSFYTFMDHVLFTGSQEHPQLVESKHFMSIAPDEIQAPPLSLFLSELSHRLAKENDFVPSSFFELFIKKYFGGISFKHFLTDNLMNIPSDPISLSLKNLVRLYFILVEDWNFLVKLTENQLINILEIHIFLDQTLENWRSKSLEIADTFWYPPALKRDHVRTCMRDFIIHFLNRRLVVIKKSLKGHPHELVQMEKLIENSKEIEKIISLSKAIERTAKSTIGPQVNTEILSIIRFLSLAIQ